MPYTYEADAHCDTCAEARFAADLEGSGLALFECTENIDLLTDSEGNPVHDYAAWQFYEGRVSCHDFESGPCVEACGTCGRLIYGVATEDAYAEETHEDPSSADLWREWSAWRIGKVKDERDELREDFEALQKEHERVREVLSDAARGLCDWRELRETFEDPRSLPREVTLTLAA
jgi:hypothetical protein